MNPIHTSKRSLVIVLHAYTAKVSSYNEVKKVIEKSLPNSEIWIPKLPVNKFSCKDPNTIVSHLITEIDDKWKSDNDKYDGVILVGHSIGALIVRKLYVVACGENEDAPFEQAIVTKETQNWTTLVDRIILIAGVNRGWTISHHLSLKNSILWRMGIVLGNIFLFFGQKLLVLNVRRGASFITQLRIQWLSMLRHAEEKNVGNPLIIQLLGTIDDMVSPEDNIDLVTGSNFIYLDVPKSGHVDVIKMDDTLEGIERAKIFALSLTESEANLRSLQITSSEQKLFEPKYDVTDVIFVIHGIRDTGYWTQKIGRKVVAVGKKFGRKFETETSSYGYFPMLSFLLFPIRRSKVEWLMDQYTENLALYPNADFSFVGHSNGTYLLAKALEEYPACKFKNVVFAGSVVRNKYDWQSKIRNNRVSKILNFVATSDWVVAIVPKAFQSLHIQDLGSAGHDGFLDLSKDNQFEYVQGSHGAALKEELWDGIANFIVNGDIDKKSLGFQASERSKFICIVAALSPLLFVIIFFLVIGIGFAIWHFTSTDTLKTLFVIMYVLLIWKIITRL